MARVNKPICFSVSPVEESKILFLTNDINLKVGTQVPLSRILNTLIWMAISNPEINSTLASDLLDQLHPDPHAQDPDHDQEKED